MDPNRALQAEQSNIPLNQQVSAIPPKPLSRIKWISISVVIIILIITSIAGIYYLGLKNLFNNQSKISTSPANNESINVGKGYIVGISKDKLAWYNPSTGKTISSSIALSPKQFILFSPDKSKFLTVSGDRYDFKNQKRSIAVYDNYGNNILSKNIEIPKGYGISSGMADISANFGWGLNSDGIVYYLMKLVKENQPIGGVYDFEFHFVSLVDKTDTVIYKMEKIITEQNFLVQGYESETKKLILEELLTVGGNIIGIQTTTNEQKTLFYNNNVRNLSLSTDGKGFINISQLDSTIYPISQDLSKKNLLPLLNLPAKIDMFYPMPVPISISNNLIAIVSFETRKYGNLLPAEPVKVLLIDPNTLVLVKTIPVSASLIEKGQEWKGVIIEDVNENGDILTNNKLLRNNTVINLPLDFEGLSFIR